MIRVSAVTLGVSDLAASQAFYKDALGLDVRRNGNDLTVVWPDFELTLRQDPPAGRGKFHLGFKVESRGEVDAWERRLRERGTRMMTGPAEYDGKYRLLVLDPDDYQLAIFAD